MFFAIFAAIGLLGLVVAGKTILGAARAYSWRETPCTILESRRAPDGVEGSSAANGGILIRFRYEVDGTPHTSDRVSSGNGVTRSVRKLERLLFDHPAGKQAQCWVNPANAADAVLVRDSLWPALFLLVPLLFIVIGVGGIVLVWRADHAGKRAATKRESALAQRIGPRIFFGFFLVVGGTIFCVLTLRPGLMMLSARSWPGVPCEIVSSSVKAHPGNKGTTYSVEVLYRYTVGEREFLADRYDFVGGSSSGSAGKSTIVTRLPSGTRAVCFVNPSDPTDAVLDRGFQSMMWFGLLPLIFVVIGVVGLASTFRRTAKRSHPQAGDDGILR